MDRRARIMAILQRVSRKKTLPDASESLFESGYLDSFGLEQMVSELERDFGVKVPDADLRPSRFESVERIESYLEGKG